MLSNSGEKGKQRKSLKPVHFVINKIKIGNWELVRGEHGFILKDEIVAKIIFSQKKLIWEFFTSATGSKSKIEISFQVSFEKTTKSMLNFSFRLWNILKSI